MSEPFRVLEGAKAFEHHVAVSQAKGRRRYRGTTYSTPLRSQALGCHPTQAAEFNEFYKRAGITGARHEPKHGDLLIECNSARNQVMQLRGLFDRDAGYGQYAGNGTD